MAIDSDGCVIDICGGLQDLKNSILRTPLSPDITLMDDPLRILRGFRFALVKNMKLDPEFEKALNNKLIWVCNPGPRGGLWKSLREW